MFPHFCTLASTFFSLNFQCILQNFIPKLRSHTIFSKSIPYHFLNNSIMTLQISYFSSMVTYYQNEFKHKNNLIFSEKRFALLLNKHSAASKGQSMINYCQSLLFDHLYLSSNSHCDQ